MSGLNSLKLDFSASIHPVFCIRAGAILKCSDYNVPLITVTELAFYLHFFFEIIIFSFLLIINCFSLGECGTERPEHEANGNFHVQRVKKTRIWGWFPMAFSIH